MLTINYSADPGSLPSTTENTLMLYSNAVVTQVAEGTVTNTGLPVLPAAVYPSVQQAARLTCIDSAGLEFSLYIVAPRLGAFGADQVTVLPAVLAAIQTAALLDGVTSPLGHLLVSIVSGALNGPAYPGFTNF